MHRMSTDAQNEHRAQMHRMSNAQIAEGKKATSRIARLIEQSAYWIVDGGL